MTRSDPNRSIPDPGPSTSISSRTEWDRLVALGYFDDQHVEYLRGAVMARSPQGPPHAEAIRRLYALLFPALISRAQVQAQCPIALSDDSEPEPDVAVIPLGDYSRVHPTTAYLIIEVAHTSLAQDRGVKARLYAECGIPEYWIANLMDRVIEVHTQPRAGRYAAVTVARPGDRLSPVRFPDIHIPVHMIL